MGERRGQDGARALSHHRSEGVKRSEKAVATAAALRPDLSFSTRDAVQGLLPALQVPRPRRDSRGRPWKEDGWGKARGKAREWDMNDGGEKKGGGD